MFKFLSERKILFSSYLILLAALAVLIIPIFTKPSREELAAPGRNWNSQKKVEDYFIEKLDMTPEQAQNVRTKGGGMITLRVRPSTTLQAITGNLYFYGFVRNENAFKYALEHTPDDTPTSGIKVGENGTIAVNSDYRISEDMTAWEIADTLLNKPSGHFNFDEYGYFFMP